MKKNKKSHIAVCCGGVSNEREVSLLSGEQVYTHLDADRHDITLVDVVGASEWRVIKSTNPHFAEGVCISILDEVVGCRKLEDFSVVFNLLHGAFGEDGQVQALFECAGVPYTGSGVTASALGFDKTKTSSLVRAFGACVPKEIAVLHQEFSLNQASVVETCTWQIGFPCVVKPNTSGSSVGVVVVQHKKTLAQAIQQAFSESDVVLIQEMVQGIELTCGVLGNSGQHLQPLPVVQIVSKNEFFDYEAKYHSTQTQELCPAPITDVLTNSVQQLSLKVHQTLGCDGLTRSDFILTAQGKLYFLEINTLPGMTAASLCPKEAQALGWAYSDFLERIIELAIQKHSK